jgi:cobalt-zinc-cadmium efflux system protein
MHMHNHGPPSLGSTGSAKKRLVATFCVTAIIALAEVVGGLKSGSLALLADAGHMLFDLLALGVALAALIVGARPADATHTWGYRRIEVLGALVNSLLLMGVSVGIGFEAVSRYLHPEPLDINTMLGVAVVGLVANLISLMILGGGHHDMGVRGAVLHVLGDTLSSVGVIVGGVVIAYTGYTQIDALLSAMIALVLVLGSVNLMRDVANILLEAAPRNINTEALKTAIHAVDGVARVYDMHLWSITQNVPALSAHVIVADGPIEVHEVRRRIETVLRGRFHLLHSTLQMEPAHEDPDAVCSPWLKKRPTQP